MGVLQLLGRLQPSFQVNPLHAHKRSPTNPAAAKHKVSSPVGYPDVGCSSPAASAVEPRVPNPPQRPKAAFWGRDAIFWVCPHPAVGSLCVAEGRGGEEISWSLLFPAGPAATSPDSLFTSGRTGAWLGSSSAASDQNTRNLRAAAGFEDRNESARQAQVGRGR